MPILEKKLDARGEEIGIKFNPTSAMLNFAMHRAQAKNIDKTNEEILKSLDLSISLVETWDKQYGDYFRDFLVEALETFGQPLKESLHNLGWKMAMGGDFQFWKAMATTHGVVKNEVVEVNVIARATKKLEDMSEGELLEHQKQLQAQLSGDDSDLPAVSEEHSGDGEMVAAPSGGEPRSDSNRDKPLQERPLEIPDALVQDRGRSQPE